MKRMKIVFIFWCLGLIFIAACSSNSFTKSGSISRPVTGDLNVEFLFTAGSETLTWNVAFKAVNGSPTKARKYLPIKDANKVKKSEQFPKEIADTILSSAIEGLLESDGDAAKNHKVHFTLTPKGAQSPVELSQTSQSFSWEKDEGAVDAFGEMPVVEGSDTDCSLESSGNQPRRGVYSVILTKPADCAFKIPKLKVTSHNGLVEEIALGSYWLLTKEAWGTSSPLSKAHTFSTSNALSNQYSKFLIDNGFILVQPNGESFLLVDGGAAIPSFANYKSTQAIANDISQTQGFGNTVLKEAKSTQSFLKGSVIAIYDDTPDMAGNIKVEELVSLSVSNGLTLTWSASSKD